MPTARILCLVTPQRLQGISHLLPTHVKGSSEDFGSVGQARVQRIDLLPVHGAGLHGSHGRKTKSSTHQSYNQLSSPKPGRTTGCTGRSSAWAARGGRAGKAGTPSGRSAEETDLLLAFQRIENTVLEVCLEAPTNDIQCETIGDRNQCSNRRRPAVDQGLTRS